MKEVSTAYLDAANEARDMLLALSAILTGLGRLCEDFENPGGLKEALFLLSQTCDGGVNTLVNAQNLKG